MRERFTCSEVQSSWSTRYRSVLKYSTGRYLYTFIPDFNTSLPGKIYRVPVVPDLTNPYFTEPARLHFEGAQKRPRPSRLGQLNAGPVQPRDPLTIRSSECGTWYANLVLKWPGPNFAFLVSCLCSHIRTVLSLLGQNCPKWPWKSTAAACTTTTSRPSTFNGSQQVAASVHTLYSSKAI